MGVGFELGMGGGAGAEESIRVHVIDPKGEKERKRIMDALHRRSVELSREAEAEAGGRVASPAKRTRR